MPGVASAEYRASSVYVTLTLAVVMAGFAPAFREHFIAGSKEAPVVAQLRPRVPTTPHHQVAPVRPEARPLFLALRLLRVLTRCYLPVIGHRPAAAQNRVTCFAGYAPYDSVALASCDELSSLLSVRNDCFRAVRVSVSLPSSPSTCGASLPCGSRHGCGIRTLCISGQSASEKRRWPQPDARENEC
jgi:hypothetical protein